MKLRSSCLAVESTKVSIQGRVAVFQARPVEIREIDTHSPLPISLLDHNYDRQLVEVVYFSNEICFQQLPDFFCYRFVSLLCEHSLFL